MGLEKVNSALEKIVGFTEKVADGQIGNVMIPRVVFNDSIGLEAEEVHTLGELVDSVKASAGKLLQITRQIACLKYLFTDKGFATDILGRNGHVGCEYRLRIGFTDCSGFCHPDTNCD